MWRAVVLSMDTVCAIPAGAVPDDDRTGSARRIFSEDAALRQRIERAIVDHAEEIWRYLVHRSGDAHFADEVLSEVFLQCLRGVAAFEDRGVPLRHWLFRIASAKATEHYRRASRGVRMSELTDADVCDQSIATSADGAHPNARHWRAALSALPADQQDVLVLHHIHGLSIEQIAVVADCAAGTVKSRLHRARAAIRRLVGEHGGHE